ncbi:hypothetical protein [Nannocystis bainbridge]|uniref:Lipoprotein n=1 Tax=Nannocystis bainbridge TaxID=2995303 RepID=A0ABT5DQI3_9BACT|nr:hypothetical protein [Nannocystis bainbridge]MDC0715915.1 hypothetical protein [Nannocystis bainbridge]
MSVRRRALAFAVLPLLPGCFRDDGAALTQTAASLEPGTSTSTGPTTGTTGAIDPTTTTSGEPDTATTDPDTTGTTAPPLCPGEMQCTPGEVMDTGALCETCGRVRRTCQDDCTWGADACFDDPTSCAYWYFDEVQLGWERIALPQPPPRHAPAAPAIAAFDLHTHDQIFVLTATTYHVLRGSDGSWLASGPLADVFPGLPFPLLQSYAVYQPDFDNYIVYAVGDPIARLYSFAVVPDGFMTEYATEDACCGSFTQLVNPGTPAAVRDLFIDLTPPFSWVGGQFYATCVDELLPLTQYAAWVTPTDVFVQDLAFCFEMVAQSPIAQFPPFAAPGAPPGERIGGVAMLGERLYVFAGE